MEVGYGRVLLQMYLGLFEFPCVYVALMVLDVHVVLRWVGGLGLVWTCCYLHLRIAFIYWFYIDTDNLCCLL